VAADGRRVYLPTNELHRIRGIRWDWTNPVARSSISFADGQACVLAPRSWRLKSGARNARLECGGKRAGPRGEASKQSKPSRREGRVFRLSLCCPVHLIRTGAAGISRYRPSMRPLGFQRV